MRTVTVYQSAAELLANAKSLPPGVSIQLTAINQTPTFVGQGAENFACEGFTTLDVIVLGASQLGLPMTV